MWACTECTFANALTVEACDMCFNPRPLELAAAAAAAATAGGGGSPRDPLAAAFDNAHGEVDLIHCTGLDHPDKWGTFLALLATSSSVRCLCLAHCHLTSTHCNDLADALSSAGGLVELDLSFNQLSSTAAPDLRAFRCLSAALREHCPDLQRLFLSHNPNLNEDAAVALGELMQSSARLHTLQMDGNAIGDEGVFVLAAALPNGPQRKGSGLRSLGLVAVGATDVSGDALCQALLVGCQLVHLDLTGNHMSQGTRAALQQAATSLPRPVDLRL